MQHVFFPPQQDPDEVIAKMMMQGALVLTAIAFILWFIAQFRYNG